MVMAIGVMAPTRALTRVATVVTRPARRSSLKPGINAAMPVKSRTRAPWISPTMNEITIRTPRQRHQLSLVRFQLLPSACTGPAPSAKSAGNETAQRTRTQITTGIVTIKTEPAITHPQRNRFPKMPKYRRAVPPSTEPMGSTLPAGRDVAARYKAPAVNGDSRRGTGDGGTYSTEFVYWDWRF